MADAIYLDHNATTPLAPAVADAMEALRRRPLANPASQHAAGREARRLLEAARVRVASLLGARTVGRTPDRLVLTSGGTESNTLALRGLIGRPPRRLVISAVEHPSVSATADQMQREGYAITRLPVDGRGVASVAAVAETLVAHEDVGLVSVMLGNNETGVLQPILEIAEVGAAHGVPVHTDAVQAVGKTAVDFTALGVTAMSFTAHKFHGPPGVGGLLLKGDAPLSPLFYGGFQQAGARPGTEPVDLALGLQAALDLWEAEREDRAARLTRLRDRLESAVRAATPDTIVIGEDAPRLPHTSCVAFPGVDRQALTMALDLAGVACSTGSACASGSSEPSPTLLAMGLSNDVVQSAIRLSLGALTTEDEIDQAARRISHTANGLRARNSG